MATPKPDFGKLAQTAQLDQAAAGLVSIARLLAAFYQELLAGDVPHDTAATLTRDYFEAMRERMFPE